MPSTAPHAEWLDYAAYCRRRPITGGRPRTVSGTVVAWPDFYSPQLHNRRDILVYLPPSYDSGRLAYPVLYMHDGQNLFDEATSYAGEWHVDETMEMLSDDGVEAIVVGIPNAGQRRLAEYSPFPDPELGGGQGRVYLEFIIHTLKPHIDASFRTRPERAHTGIAGSSMGGLISLYGFLAFPATFGLAGVMSPSVWYGRRAILPYVKDAPLNPGRLYLDAGRREYGGSPADQRRRARSRGYYASVRKLYRLLYQKGYQPQRNLLYREEKGGQHHEPAWSRRLPQALRFLLAESSPREI